jgi:hypothetical protein
MSRSFSTVVIFSRSRVMDMNPFIGFRRMINGVFFRRRRFFCGGRV